MSQYFFIKRTEVRPVSDIPRAVIIIFLLALVFQLGWHAGRPDITARAKALPEPPSTHELKLISIGDSIALSKMMMLWLQAFDNQPGISIPFKQLDYDMLINWLGRVLILDSRAQYPMLAASRVYSEVPDDAKKRQILEFVHRKFLAEPDMRWSSLAHAVYVAKYRLQDLPLALRYAHSLAEHVTAKEIPAWVKQMEIYVLEDMGEIESAKVLIGGLLESGTITDAHELMFLQERLQRLEQSQQ